MNELDNTSPIIITKARKGLVKDNAGRDCLIGVGACALGGLFVQASGSTLDELNPPQGFYATVGDKYVEGGAAVFTGAIWTSGCVFGIKGIIELFRPRTQEASVQKSLTLASMSADKIISGSGLFKNNEKEFTSSESNTSDIIAYVNAQIY